MVTAIYMMVGGIMLGVFYVIGRIVLKTDRKFGGKMLVTCPETQQTAGVTVDTSHAVLTAVRGEPDLHLKTCTRWPERQNCGQECLAQIEASPENCLVRTMLATWYKGKSCVFCGQTFPKVDSYDHRSVFWYDQKPAFLSPEGKVVEWLEIPVERLPQVMTSHKPICWNCLIAETFRRNHPELVVDRPSRRNH